jgi:hypothetical protein
MRAIRRLLAGFALLALAAAPSNAQQRPGLVEVSGGGGRHGFWLGAGIGAGGEQFDLADGLGYSDALYKPAFWLRGGGTLGQHFRLGGEISAWVNDRDRATESVSSFLAIAQFYPFTSTGLYLKGGLGLGRSAVTFDDGFDTGDTGFAGAFGAGWEIPVGAHFAIVPAVDWVGQSFDQRGSGTIHERVVTYTLGVVWQPH